MTTLADSVTGKGVIVALYLEQALSSNHKPGEETTKLEGNVGIVLTCKVAYRPSYITLCATCEHCVEIIFTLVLHLLKSHLIVPLSLVLSLLCIFFLSCT